MKKRLNDLLYRTETGKKIGGWWVHHGHEVTAIVRATFISFIIYEITDLLRRTIRRKF